MDHRWALVSSLVYPQKRCSFITHHCKEEHIVVVFLNVFCDARKNKFVHAGRFYLIMLIICTHKQFQSNLMYLKTRNFSYKPDRDWRSIFLGFEFRKSKICIFLGTAHSCRIFWVVRKCCIFKFHSFNSIFWVQFYAPGTSVITVLHYYHITLNFCQMTSVSGGYFLGFCFSESIFLGVSGKVFFWVVQKYPTPLIPLSVCLSRPPPEKPETFMPCNC